MATTVNLPDVLTGSRLLLGPVFVVVYPASPVGGFVIACAAAGTDFLDGRLARRLGSGSSRGAALDVVGDAVFVLCGLAALAWSGVISLALPVAAAVSLLALARAWSGESGAPVVAERGPADILGHAAGILNYGAVLVGSGFVAFGIAIPLGAASVLVALVNVAPIIVRARGAR